MRDLIAEERSLEVLPEDWPTTRQLRWRLLHGEELTNRQVIAQYGGSETRLVMTVKSLEDKGVHVAREKRDGVMWYKIQTKRPYKAHQPRPTHSNGSTSPSFSRPAPSTPALGLLLRVVMVAEEDGAPLAVLADVDGARWFAHLEQAPPLTT